MRAWATILTAAIFGAPVLAEEMNPVQRDLLRSKVIAYFEATQCSQTYEEFIAQYPYERIADRVEAEHLIMEMARTGEFEFVEAQERMTMRIGGCA